MSHRDPEDYFYKLQNLADNAGLFLPTDVLAYYAKAYEALLEAVPKSADSMAMTLLRAWRG